MPQSIDVAAAPESETMQRESQPSMRSSEGDTIRATQVAKCKQDNQSRNPQRQAAETQSVSTQFKSTSDATQRPQVAAEHRKALEIAQDTKRNELASVKSRYTKRKEPAKRTILRHHIATRQKQYGDDESKHREGESAHRCPKPVSAK